MNIKKNLNLWFLIFFCFYILLPVALFSIHFFIIIDNSIYQFVYKFVTLDLDPSNKNALNFISNVYFSTLFQIVTLIIPIILFFFIKYFIFFNTINEDHSTTQAIKIITCICGLFLLKDLYSLIINYLSDDPITNRYHLYNTFLNKRLTYVNIFLINTIFLFFVDRKWFYSCLILILLFDILTLSRIEIFYLILMGSIFFLNLKLLTLQKTVFVILLLLILVFYRAILTDQNLFNQLLWEPYSIYLNTLNFYTNLFSSENYIYSMNYAEGISTKESNYFVNDILNLFNNFFYTDFKIPNYDENMNHDLLKMSSRGANYLSLYPISMLCITCMLLIVRKIYSVLSYNYFNICIVYTFFSIFRGNFVHTAAFCLKVLIITGITIWIIKIIKL